MRKADLVAAISEKTGVPKVDVLVTLETFFKEVKGSLAEGENVYVRGFGSFIVKKRAKKIGRHIKKNKAIEIPEHFIPAFKPAKVFVEQVKDNVTALPSDESDD
ncbi:HU family DNA-binding protein [Flavilitoribacter nigricans]|uniref:Integration host factor subunit beta n=1 Tax=Flavilitoribacter nigricans (strain ATCC 23147 / DSM 23189 / NBRC 102662 / NCIMB 1420 / SS-2) TaxID=1122177 RepID=A0A2D0N6X8_FLAN2|nr:HU family DNA-binding protein [Flavilitoribacter nigricans]PHN04254.1 integration host factor subunit beta [Flavilitoribacter nigricans DSM 23189 = NBRC 102662]